MSKYIPPHLRKKLEEEKLRKEEEEKAKIIVPLSEEAKNAPPPCKWNFKAALTKNNKQFAKPTISFSHLNYDYNCIQCSKPVKREGLNKNGTNYCWYCHSKILFKNANFTDYYNSDEDEYYDNDKTQSQKLKEKYEYYLYEKNNTNNNDNFDY